MAIKDKFFEKHFPIPDCKICKNKRKYVDPNDSVYLADLEDFDYPEEYKPDPPTVTCKCQHVHNKFTGKLFSSRMTKEEILYSFKKYKKIPMTTEFVSKDCALDILEPYIKKTKLAATKQISLYLYSESLRLSRLIGCTVLTEFIKNGYYSRVFDGPGVIDVIRSSIQYGEEKYYRENLDEPDWEGIYLDDILTYDVIFLSGIDFNMSPAVKNRFCSLLSQRHRAGALTMISSTDKFFSVMGKFQLDNHLEVNLTKHDVVYEQIEMLGEFFDK